MRTTALPILRIALILTALASMALAQGQRNSVSPKSGTASKPAAGPSVTADQVWARLFSEKEPLTNGNGDLTEDGKAAFAQIEKLSVASKQKLVAPLLKELGNDRENHTWIAVTALGKVGRPALPALLDVVKNDKDPRRTAAIDAIGEMGPKGADAVPVLGPLVKDKSRDNRRLRWVALRAMADIYPSAAMPDLIEEIKLSAMVALDILGDMGPAAEPAMPAIFEDYHARHERPSGNQHAEKSEQLIRKIGKPAVPYLRNVLKQSTDESMRGDALTLLLWVGPPAAEAVPDLLEDLRTNKQPRAGIFRALEGIGPGAKAAVPAMIEALRNKDDRQMAISALGGIGPAAKEAVPLLRLALRTKDDRLYALHALGGIGPDAKDAVPELIAIMQGSEEFSNARPAPPPGYEYVFPEQRTKMILDVMDQSEAKKALIKIGTPEAMAAVKQYEEKSGK